MNNIKRYVKTFVDDVNVINLGDSIIKTFLTIDYTQRKINLILIFLTTLLLRNILNGVLCYLLYTNVHILDFIIQIALNIVLVLKTEWIYYFVIKYKQETLLVSKYFIENYTIENYRRWKKYGVIILSIYFITMCLLFDINSYVLIEYNIQFLICYLVVDNIENKNGVIFSVIDKIQELRHMKISQTDDLVIIEDYNEEETEPLPASSSINNFSSMDNSGPFKKSVSIYALDQEDFIHMYKPRTPPPSSSPSTPNSGIKKSESTFFIVDELYEAKKKLN